MDNPVQDIDNLIDSLINLKRTINRFNRNSPTVKVDSSFGIDCHYIKLKNTTGEDYNKLTNDDNYILETDYTCAPYYANGTIDITYGGVSNATIEDISLLLNKIFECLNHDVPKKSEIEEHCGLASELVSEWPQWKKDAMKHVPYTYEPPDPQ
jgi:hypothetical protein